MAEPPVPHRGEVWFAYLDPVIGHEQGRRRPVLVISSEDFHAIPSYLAIIIPITTRDRGVHAHIPVRMSEGSLSRTSFAITDQPRTISRQRLLRRIGRADGATVEETLLYIRHYLGIS